MALVPGENFGPYRMGERLGVGGMASVYHAFQPNPEREVALKVISPELAALPAFRGRFRREANVLARLEHPNILPIYETGEAEGLSYICYRYVRGGTLKDLLTGPLSVGETVRLLAPVAEALDFAHSQGVIHRDIKPANILLTSPDANGQRTPLVADFGIARLLEPTLPSGELTQTLHDGPESLTQAGVGLGTPTYMAPEQVLGRVLDGRADQYALAITAYYMLTGAPPYSATTPAELAYMHVSEPLPLPRSRNPAILPAVEQMLVKALAKHPTDRYPSCSAFLSALAALTSAAPVPHARTTQWRRLGAAAAAVVVLGGATITGVMATRYHSQHDTKQSDPLGGLSAGPASPVPVRSPGATLGATQTTPLPTAASPAPASSPGATVLAQPVQPQPQLQQPPVTSIAGPAAGGGGGIGGGGGGGIGGR